MNVSDRDLVAAVLEVWKRHPEWPLDRVLDAAACVPDNVVAVGLMEAIEREAEQVRRHRRAPL